MKKIIAMLLAVSVFGAAFAACGGPDSKGTEQRVYSDDETVSLFGDSKNAASEYTTYTPEPLVENEKLGFTELSLYKLPPITMESESTVVSADGFDFHLRADITALENDLGFRAGEWIPFLTVEYKIMIADGTSVTDGVMHPVNSSDGPHYGANVRLDKGRYNITITVRSPGENGYLIETDNGASPGGSLKDAFKDGPLTYTYEGWNFSGN